MGDEGLEPKVPTACEASGCEKQPPLGGAESGAVLPDSVSELPPELAIIVRRWPALSAAVRQQIMALVKEDNSTP